MLFQIIHFSGKHPTGVTLSRLCIGSYFLLVINYKPMPIIVYLDKGKVSDPTKSAGTVISEAP